MAPERFAALGRHFGKVRLGAPRKAERAILGDRIRSAATIT